jgi:hypothetical protein
MAGALRCEGCRWICAGFLGPLIRKLLGMMQWVAEFYTFECGDITTLCSIYRQLTRGKGRKLEILPR